MSRRRCFALDLKSDASLIREYCRMHEPGSVWPQVIAHIRAEGVEDMQIWQRDDRLFMIIEASEDYPRPVADPNAREANARWQALMAGFQRRLAHTPPEEKWASMRCIFTLGEHVGKT
jgi:L-rhamnose mutarotase